MSVSDPLDSHLLRAFGRLEFKLKQRSRFIRPNQRDAMVNWREINAAVLAMPRAQFVGQVSEATRRKILLGTRDRPKVQEVVMDGGLRKAEFRRRALDITGQQPSDAVALLEAARRVRNNLFHGGKDDQGEQPFDGDDDEWAEAALDVAYTLLALVDQGAFGPPDHP
ncbi:hypothetical protein [Pseudoxanthomonas mexicana]|uniref:hypothetical protein n=1 Tax=Pseudoxanthomonas mexicana TaxID=128785 RepID=UPI0028B14AB2|nr:hypothetical protein [Pseudoxanthomonas mexicana]